VDRPRNVDVIRHIVLDELEVAVLEMRDVRNIAGEQVVDADDRVAAIEQRFAEMRPDETGRPRNHHAWLCHVIQTISWLSADARRSSARHRRM
jgi:hypothetical protein